MGNKQSIRREQEVHLSSRKDGAQTTHTLSSLKANKPDGYTFTIPKNWDNMTTDCHISGGELGDRKFVPVDRTRCMLRHKGKTEAILLRNYQTQTIHVCSFIPPGNENGDGHPLFEWGVIGKSKKKNGGYTMNTPFDGNYFVRGRGVTMPSSSSSNQHISRSNSSNSNNNNTMVVTTFQNGDNKTCATFEETDDKWICHTMYGIDPIMMVCFIVALDTLRTMKKKRSGSVISNIRPAAIGMLGNSSNRGSRFSLLSSSKLSLSSSSSSNNVGNKMSKSNSSINSSSKTLEYGYSKPTSNGSCSYTKASSQLQQHDMPPMTSFINARAA